MTATLDGRRLYLCTPDRLDLATFVAACITGGVDVVQLREKSLEARDLIARGRELARVCADHGVPFIMNDRPDLALEIGADGVHVGQEDAPVALVRRIMGEGAIVGLSTHSPEDLAGAVDQRVDYLSAGPVVPTPTKPGRPGTGLDYVGLAVRRARCPVFVTGGVTPSSVARVAAAGARHFVVVRWLTEAEEPREAARTLRAAVDRAVDRDPEGAGQH